MDKDKIKKEVLEVLKKQFGSMSNIGLEKTAIDLAIEKAKQHFKDKHGVECKCNV